MSFESLRVHQRISRSCLGEGNTSQNVNGSWCTELSNMANVRRPDVALLCPENQLRSSRKGEGLWANRPRLISPRSIAATGAQGGKRCNGFVRGPTQAGESPGTAPRALHLLQLLARLKQLISRHAPTITRQVGSDAVPTSTCLPTSLQHNQSPQAELRIFSSSN